MRRFVDLGFIVTMGALAACYKQPSGENETDADGSGTAGDDDGTLDAEGGPTPGTTPDGPDDDGPDSADDNVDTTDDGPDDPCGNGRIDAGEVCDDGVNDGSYGGCLPDCSGLAAYCGDGRVQDPELCDEGDANANGSGCNVDCVTSGTIVATLEMPGLAFCEGGTVSKPVFRDNGNALIAVTGYCSNDARLLLEVAPDGELVDQFEVLLPHTPIRGSTMRGDDWLMASWQCNYVLPPDGPLTEVCDSARQTGETGLFAIDEQTYFTLDGDGIARYGGGSPELGDTPEWLVPQQNQIYFYDFAPGTSGSIVVVGERYLGMAYYSYVAQYTAAGNLVVSNYYASPTMFSRVAVASNGTIYAASSSSMPRVVVLSSNLNVQSEALLPALNYSYVNVGVDSADEVVIFYQDPNYTPTVVKRDPTLSLDRWTVELPGQGGWGAGFAIDAADYIWIGSAEYEAGGMATLRLVRVSP